MSGERAIDLSETNKELTDAFGANAQSIGKANKNKVRDQIKKKAFLTELITIILTDLEGKAIPGCEWRLTRKKLNLKTLHELLKRSGKPLEVDYFYDETGAAFWIDDLVLQAKPSPSRYCIVPKVKRVPFDIGIDPKYEGQTSFMVRGVPLKAKDERTMVEKDTLREWIITAIVEEDPYSR
jgi:hypothetical protein